MDDRTVLPGQVGEKPSGRVFRIVTVSSCYPYDAIDHAGGRYLVQLESCWRSFAEVTYLVSDFPENREHLTSPGAPRRIVLLSAFRSRCLVLRGANRLLFKVQDFIGSIDPTFPSLTMASRLMLDPRLRRLIRECDIVDLQWTHQARLLRIIRRLNPDAWVVGTFHDCVSQVLTRYAERRHEGRRTKWRVAAWLARRAEARTARDLDVALTFSDKDRGILDPEGSRGVEVVSPAQQIVGPVPRKPAPEPTCVFVAHYARPENDDAARWLLQRVWPRVRLRHPDSRLRLIGSGATPALLSLARSVPGVSMDGFVPDLSEAFGEAWCSLVPMRFGGGIKFKTLESLLAGVPTISTHVGAEGVHPIAALAAIRDDEAGFADAVIDVLDDPTLAVRTAASHEEALQAVYGRDAFAAAITRLYTRSMPV